LIAFLAVIRNEITQLYRDVWYLFLMIVGATVTLVTMAYTLSTPVEGISALVVNLDQGRHSRQVVQALANDAFFTIETATAYQETKQHLQTGQAKILIVIPEDYSRAIDRGEGGQIQALIDGSEPGIAELARDHIAAIATDLSLRLLSTEMARQGLPASTSLAFRPQVRYNASLETIVSVVPGLMAIVLTVPAVGAASAFARERERGNFELVISTPLGRWPLLLGRVFPYVLIGLFDIGIFTAVGRFAFGVPLRGDLALFALLGLLYIFATASSGVFLAQFLQTQHTAAIATFMLFGITPVYLSDIFFPASSMPAWLQQLSTLLPATHFTIIARGILLKGIDLTILWPNALVLAAMGTIMSVLAYQRLQKKLG
jgi:ABC-2 type transport system permease protein